MTYEGNVFPEEVRWTQSGTMDADRWIDDGWFFQSVDLGIWKPPPGGEQDRYQRFLGDFVGEDNFFIEWRMETDGDRSEIGGVAPSSLVASGVPSTGVSYHFTIAMDQVRLIRDNFLPIVFLDIDPDAPHTYRLELYGNTLYVWYLDGVVADSGVPEGAFPTSESNVISFRAKSWFLESTTKWDYIRYGTIPVDGSGDFDSDGKVDGDDFYFFQECLASGAPGIDAGPGCRWADMDQDSDVDFHDFRLFQLAFTGGE